MMPLLFLMLLTGGNRVRDGRSGQGILRSEMELVRWVNNMMNSYHCRDCFFSIWDDTSQVFKGSFYWMLFPVHSGALHVGYLLGPVCWTVNDMHPLRETLLYCHRLPLNMMHLCGQITQPMSPEFSDLLKCSNCETGRILTNTWASLYDPCRTHSAWIAF